VEQTEYENLETETEICGTKMEAQIIWREWTRKHNDVFWAEQMQKQKILFSTNTKFSLWLFCMANLAGPICDLVILNRQSKPSPIP
jgi:hypothetical protein